MAERVTGEQYVDVDGQMWEIKRQLRQKNGYPYDLKQLMAHLQAAIEGNLVDRNGDLFSKSLLKGIGTIVLGPGSEGDFVVREKFVINTGKEDGVKISFIGDNFRDYCLAKTEQPGVQVELSYWELTRPSSDRAIIAEFDADCNNSSLISLRHVFGLLSRQSNGGEGVLLNDGRANILYVVDVVDARGLICPVTVRFSSNGWKIYTDDIYAKSCSHKRDSGSRVFFRKS